MSAGREPGQPTGSALGLPAVAAYLTSARDGAALTKRASRLGVALAGMAQELVAARREIAVLRRENSALRSKLEAAGAS